MTRLLLAAIILSLNAAASPQAPPRPRVEETSPRARAQDDPTIHPSAGSRPPALPARALAERGREEPGERRTEGWALAQWKVYTLQLPSSARLPIAITTPSILMIRASWPTPADLTISVLRGGTSLKSVRGVSAPLGGQLATARIDVASPGQVVVAASGTGSATVTLHVGILPAR